jgi:hypothetical protein
MAAHTLANNNYQCIFDFFRTGILRFYQPVIIDHYHNNNAAPSSLDMLGIVNSKSFKVKFYSNMEIFVAEQVPMQESDELLVHEQIGIKAYKINPNL